MALEERKEKIKNWLKDRNNLIFVLIILFAVILRLYYFFLTQNQPLWWDEADYLAVAKHYAGIIDYNFVSVRLPGFSILMAGFYLIGISNEVLLRFIVLFIPSIITIILTYFALIEMYSDKKIALIGTAMISVLWEHLFYSNRFQTENLSLVFALLVFIVLFRVYIKKKDLGFIKPKYSLIWVAILCFASLFFRVGNIPFIPAIVLFIILLNKSKIFCKKGILVSAGVMLIFLIFFFVLLQTPAKSLISTYYHPENKITWESLTIFQGFYASLSNIPPLLFYFFLFGIVLFIFDSVIYPEKYKNFGQESSLEFKSDIFNLLLIACFLLFFALIIRANGFEYRWFFTLLVAMFAFTGKGLVSIAEIIGDWSKFKKIVPWFIVVIVITSMYGQIMRVDPLIKNKLSSYMEVKEAALWINDHSNQGDSVISASIPQNSFYSERTTYGFSPNETTFNSDIQRIKPKFIVLSVFEPVFTPNWAYTWPQRNLNLVEPNPVKVYLLNNDKSQPALIIYRLKY